MGYNDKTKSKLTAKNLAAYMKRKKQYKGYQISRLHKITVKKNIVIRVDGDTPDGTTIAIVGAMLDYIEQYDCGKISDFNTPFSVIYE